MDRKEFIRKCCVVCAGLPVFLQSCSSGKIVSAPMVGSDLSLAASEFEYLKKDQIQYRSYIVVQNDRLEYPVCVYRNSPSDYTALWMRCTHQGTELQAFGDKLHCPAHGSEFNKNGGVENGPAAEALRTFPVSVSSGQVKISLK